MNYAMLACEAEKMEASRPINYSYWSVASNHPVWRTHMWPIAIPSDMQNTVL